MASESTSKLNATSLPLMLVAGDSPLSSDSGLLLLNAALTPSAVLLSSPARTPADSTKRPEPGTNSQTASNSATTPAAPRPIFSP